MNYQIIKECGVIAALLSVTGVALMGGAFLADMCKDHVDSVSKEAQRYCEESSIKETRILELESYIRYLHDNNVPMMNIETVTTGIRNRNPMNVFARGSKDPWFGQVGKDEKGHAIFASFEHGLRAGAIVLLRYYDVHKLDTVEKIINRYCTGNKKAYITFICKKLKVGATDVINVAERLPDLMKAMVHFENGYQVFPDEMYIPYSVYR